MFKKFHYIFIANALFILFLAFYGCQTSQSVSKQRMNSVENGLLKTVVFKGQKPEKMKLSQRMPYYGVPGLSIAVIDNYQIEWTKAYGVLNNKKHNSTTTESLFQAASISQAATAVEILRLAEKQVLVLDTSVNDYLKSWKVPQTRFNEKEKVTAIRLLSHSAGVIKSEYSGYTQDEELPSLKQILEGEKPAQSPAVRINYIPGTKNVYSEAGYTILQQLIEDLEDDSFSMVMKKNIFNPLGMNHSSFECPLSEEIKTKTASGHLRDGKPVEGKYRNYPQTAAAGLWSTSSDVALLVIEIMKTAIGDSNTVISPLSARTMLTRHISTSGLGVNVEDKGDNLYFFKRGRNYGFNCMMVGYPVKGQGAVVMTNSDNGAYLIDEVIRAVSEVYNWPHFKPLEKTLYRLKEGEYQQFEGVYQINPDYLLEVKHENYYLVIKPTGQTPTKFYVETRMVFFSRDPYIKIRFKENAEGQITGLVLRQRDIYQEATKIK
ncbi:MAG: serine hydrolase domain-containing protein [Candidatus Aminicenantaceae bacterium]